MQHNFTNVLTDTSHTVLIDTNKCTLKRVMFMGITNLWIYKKHYKTNAPNSKTKETKVQH